MKTPRLLMNDSAASEEGARLLKEAGIDFRRIPANGPSMPVLLVGNEEFAGLVQIRWYLHALQTMRREATE